MLYPLLFPHLIRPILALKDPEERSVSHCLRHLRRTQWLSKDELTHQAEQRLRALIDHAATFVPYYRDLFRRNGIEPRSIRHVSDLQRLPPLTKESLRANLTVLTTPGTERTRLSHQTGGSTGEPLTLYIDRRVRKSWSRAACIRAWEWTGWREGESMCNLWGSYLDRSPNPPLGERLFHFLHRSHWLDAFALSEDTLPTYVQRLRELRPVALRGYTSALYVVARHMLKAGINDLRPRAILTTTEKLYSPQRSAIERAFGCPVFDYYGNRETNLIASECPAHSGYHVAIETAIVEVARNGDVVAPGEAGDLLITDLHNFTTPLIRYEVGDQVTTTDKICSCGRGLPLIQEIVGRSHDIIVTPEGAYLHGELFTHAFWDCAWLSRFQIVQESINELQIFLVGDARGREKDLENALAYLRRYVGSQMRIDVQFVSDIPKTRSGKFRFVLSRVADCGRGGTTPPGVKESVDAQ